MTSKLQGLIESITKQEYATTKGREVHKKLQRLFFDSNGVPNFYDELVARIKQNSELIELMGCLSKTEVPIAGFVNGKFISRRIDRLYVNPGVKKVVVLDYKTDMGKNLFYKKYVEQLTEYYALLKQIYNGFDVECKILWTNDFTLENII